MLTYDEKTRRKDCFIRIAEISPSIRKVQTYLASCEDMTDKVTQFSCFIVTFVVVRRPNGYDRNIFVMSTGGNEIIATCIYLPEDRSIYSIAEKIVAPTYATV